MKHIILSISMLLMLAACQNKNERKPAKAVVTDTVEKKEMRNEREIIITELSKLKTAFAQKDKESILSYFNFPLADSSVNFFEVDSVFDKQRLENNGAITRGMFANAFDKIYTFTEMNEFNKLFKLLDIEELKDRDEISKDVHIKNDGCYYIYNIRIKGRKVMLQYGTNSDREYREAHPDEEEVCSEYAMMWAFELKGNKLKFLEHRIAG